MVDTLPRPMSRLTSGHATLASLVLALAVSPCTMAADLYVTTTTDDAGPCLPGSCSLRAAVLAANSTPGDDTIHLGRGTFALSIAGVGEDAAATGDLDLTESGSSIVVLGAGPGATVVDAQGVDRVFHVLPGVGAALVGLTITGGGHPSQGGVGGGGVLHEGGMLWIRACELTGNSTGDGPELYGGGVNVAHADSGLILWFSTISGCSATAGGGGVAVADPAAGASVTASTLVGNSAPYGGAVHNTGVSVLGNSTISDNFSTEGAPGIMNLGTVQLVQTTVVQPLGLAILNGFQGEVELTNTAILGQCSNLGTYVSNGGNLESSGDTCHLGSSDLSNVASTLVEPLAWNGGPTMTHRFGAGSVAVDFPPADLLASVEDQRFVDRPQDGNGDGSAIRDIGAVERLAGELVVHTFEGGFTTGWSATVD